MHSIKKSCQPANSRNFLIVILFLVFYAFPAQGQTTNQSGESSGFFIAPLVEVIGFSRKGPAFGGGLAMGMGEGVAIGWRFLYAVDTESVHTLELAVFMRFYVRGSNAVTGPFIQLNAGAAIHALESFPSFPADAGGLSADIAVGWRFPIGQRWYIEPLIRVGYAYIAGVGVSFAFRL